MWPNTLNDSGESQDMLEELYNFWALVANADMYLALMVANP